MAPTYSLEQAMAVNLSIKGVPDGLADRLRRRAEANHRSLQGELMSIVEQAVTQVPTSALPRRQWKTIDEYLAERRVRGPVTGWNPADLPKAVDIIRADRDNR